VTTISYDAAGRVDDLTSTVGGSPVTSFDYTVNRLGQREQVVEAVGGTTRTIGYDYDALGRRTALNDATGTTSFVPDALGRVVQVTAPDTGTIGYQYNRRGQRTQLSYPDGSTVIDYTYHADGQLDEVRQQRRLTQANLARRHQVDAAIRAAVAQLDVQAQYPQLTAVAQIVRVAGTVLALKA
jgi:YD repeat-containing protein